MTENKKRSIGKAYQFRGRDKISNKDMYDLCDEYLTFFSNRNEYNNANIRGIIYMQQFKYLRNDWNKKATYRNVMETTAVLDTLDNLVEFDLIKKEGEQ